MDRKSFSHEWTGDQPRLSTDSNGGGPFDLQNQKIYKIGIYGWRKRCLYFLVILLMTMVIINLTLTVWIMRVMDFSVSGMGNLRILTNGLRLEGEAEFLNGLYAAEIRSRKESSLTMESAQNITINARNKRGIITNRLFVGENLVESLTSAFTIKNSKGEILFHVDDDEVVVAADRLRVSGEGGVLFKEAVQTAIVRAESTQQLRLESPTRTIRLKAPEGIGIESRAGDITATCLKDLRLQSKEGAIWLDSERVEMKNIRTAIPSSRPGPSYPGIYQLCACQNGRLFLSPPEGYCNADTVVCR